MHTNRIIKKYYAKKRIHIATNQLPRMRAQRLPNGNQLLAPDSTRHNVEERGVSAAHQPYQMH